MVPPPPPAWAPPSAPSKGSLSALQSELEAIRAKGLAKIFNRHFTSVTETVAREREAAESALAELERRKEEMLGRPKEFRDANGYTLTQLESMSLELQRRKLEVQRKERENMELYRRYVSQFGPGDASALSLGRQKSASSIPNNNSLTIVHEHDSDDDDDDHRGENAPPPTDSLVRQQTDLFLARLMQDQAAASAPLPSANTSTNIATRDLHFSSDSTNAMTPSPTNQHKGAALNDTAQSPPARPSAPNAQDFPSTDSTSPATPDSASDDASADSNAPLVPAGGGRAVKKTAFSPGTKSASSLGHGPFFGVSTVTTGASEVDVPQDEDNSDDSLMSGLTSMDGATIADAEFKLTEFLRSETDNIRKMFMGGNNTGNDDSFSVDDTSTIVSAESRRAVDAAKAAEDMARQMADATAWMKNPSSSMKEDDDDDDDEKEPVALPPSGKEWFAYWSLEHQREYYHNVSTNQTSWTKPLNVEIDVSTFQKPKIATGADEEGGVVVQDYTKKRTKKREDQAMLDNMAMIEEFRPDTIHRTFSDSVRSGTRGEYGDATSVASGSTRKTAASVMEFRRRRARQKFKRRIRVLGLVAGIITAGAALFYSRDKWLPLAGLRVPEQSATDTSFSKSSSPPKRKKKSKRKKSLPKKVLEEEAAAAVEAVKEAAEESKREKQAAEEAKAAEEEKIRKELEERKRKAAAAARIAAGEERLRKEAAELDRLLEEEKTRKEAAAAKTKALEEERVRQELIAKIREEERQRLEEESARAQKDEEAEALAARANEVQRKKKEAEAAAAEAAARLEEEEEERKRQREAVERAIKEDKSRRKNGRGTFGEDKPRRGRFSYLVSKKRFDAAMDDPLFDLERLIDLMF